MPTVRYYLSTTAEPIDGTHPLWNQPLPDRQAVGSPRPDPPPPVRYGEFFTAVAAFCGHDGWAVLRRAAAARLERPVAAAELTDLSIFLEKHGAFYHPARLLVSVGDHPLAFVVNLAGSADGRRILPREVKALDHLNRRRPFGWFPLLYGSRGGPRPMFLGDWFEGFHEFHLTRPPHGGDPAVVVWDGAPARRLLSDDQAAALYRQAAMILSACYDPVTTHRIAAWHHAAGDFVVRLEDDALAVRLITVRDYAPLIDTLSDALDERMLMDTLVDFFVSLTLGMRLDRLDGVAAIVWAPAVCLAPVIDGFFQGLDLTCRLSGLPEALPPLFRAYFNHQDAAALTAAAHRLADALFDRRSDEHRVIHDNLDRHVDRLRRLMAARE